MSVKEIPDGIIVVTGACGFIGAGIVRYLNDLGIDRLLLVDDIGKTEKWKNLLGKKFFDLIGIDQLFPWLEGKQDLIRGFIHLGACSDTLEKDGNYILENNYRYTRDLAVYALTHGHRFIYASSAATYGAGEQGFIDDHHLIEQLRPLNLYGYSKQIFDLWAKREGVLDQVVGLKYFNIFGPNENDKGRMASMVYKTVPTAKKEGVIRLFKSSDPKSFPDGGQCRDFLYVKDAVAMTCAFLDNQVGGIFNIGLGKATTWNEVAHAIFEALALSPRIDYFPMPEDLAGQYQNYTCADMTKYFSLGGMPSPAFSVREGVIDYVRNYLIKDARW